MADENKILYQSAFGAYIEAEKLITEMCRIAEKITPFPLKTALNYFDVILQAILFKLAMADEHIHLLEYHFVMKICKHYNIMSLINNKLNLSVKINWETIKKADKKKQAYFEGVIDSIVSEIVDGFSKPMAAADAVTKFDYMAALSNCIGIIISAAMQIDGVVTQGEIGNATRIFKNIFLKKFQNYKNHFTRTLIIK